MSKGDPSVKSIILSTLGSIAVCALLVALASDDQPLALMDWGKIEQSQMMDGYKMAVTAGDSPTLDKALNREGSTTDLSLVSGEDDTSKSTSEANKELLEFNKLSSTVLPKHERRASKHLQTSDQMLDHYKKLSSQVFPSHLKSRKFAKDTAQGELNGYNKLWSQVFSDHTSKKHDSWHQTSGDLLAQYAKVSNEALPSEHIKAAKRHMTAKQELAHFKALSSQAFPSESHVKKVLKSTLYARRVPKHSSYHTLKLEQDSDFSTIAGGLKLKDVKVGTGAEPKVGDTIKVQYTGKLDNGSVFDSGVISFAFGQGKVIRGWDEGLRGMHEGGERLLVIPPELAYGARGTPGGPIPPGATLHFDVKLLEA